MPSCRHRAGPKNNLIEDKQNLMEKLKKDKTALEKRIAEQTKEFNCDYRHTERRLKTWMDMDPDNCELFERRLKRLAEHEAKDLERRISSKMKSVVKERRYLQSRLIWFQKSNSVDCVKESEPDNGRSKKKHQRKHQRTTSADPTGYCGVG